MAKLTTAIVRDYLLQRQGREVTLDGTRKELGILPNTPPWDDIRGIFFQLAEQRIVKPSGKRDGVWKVITQVQPVPIFSANREIRPPFELIFPRDFSTMMEMNFAEDVVIREGDLVLISGLSNFGKTTICLNICGENIDKRPVLMGNEYTVLVPEEPDSTKMIWKGSERFINRLAAMSEWIPWQDKDGKDKFILFPVRDDYADHIVKDRINIIDWINIDTGEHYMIGNILESIKRNLGRGVAVIAIQKSEGATAGRGGQFTKDFADLELLIDKFGDSDVLLTIGKCKESLHPVTGKTYAYSIWNGIKIQDFREVKKCPDCRGSGYKAQKECETCHGRKYVNR